MTTQKDINGVWGNEWKKGARDAQAIFQHRLFLEGYPVFSKYITRDARTILDVGAGTGRYGLRFAEEHKDAEVTITDILDESLLHIRSSAKQMGLNNVTIQKESVLQLSFPDNTFDIVFCDVVIQHLPDYRNAFAEMVRVLQPGGVLIVSTNNLWNLPHTAYKYAHQVFGKPYRYGYERSFTRNELSALAKENTMEVIALDGFYFAYGVYRWKEHFQIFKLVGGALNRVSKFLDQLTQRRFSKYFGFEIFVVAKKKQH